MLLDMGIKIFESDEKAKNAEEVWKELANEL
jgi:hypothetical protein